VAGLYIPRYPDIMTQRLPDKKQTTWIRRRLLRWYRQNCRKLPWRAAPIEPGKSKKSTQSSNHPYRVLVSEAMLQQTQVVTVINYFNRFMKRFPTVAKLAAADEQEVLRLWAGLGYYRRARHLHAAAKQIIEQHNGQVPGDFESLKQLPGIGRYSAGAIGSIAFGLSIGVLDGNVARVFSRLFAIREPVNTPLIQDRLWALADHLVAPTVPGDFNQAVMELGALVCTPRKPNCDQCPLQKNCRAHKQKLVDQLPAKEAKRKPTAVEHHILAIEANGSRAQSRYLFEQRPAKGLWSNMWQLPTFENQAEMGVAKLRALATQSFATKIKNLKKITEFGHQTTHRTITFTLWHCKAQSGASAIPKGQWRMLDQIDELPMAKPQHMAIKMIRDLSQ
jgi:A/G-specific adenine glycosylase